MEIIVDNSVSDRYLIAAFGVSLAFHLTLISLAMLATQLTPPVPTAISVKLVESVAERPNPVPITPPKPKLKTQSITAPKLLSKPELLETQPLVATGTTNEESKERSQPVPQPASLPVVPGASQTGSNVGSKSGEAEGSVAGVGNFYGKGDISAVGGAGQGAAGLGRGAKGDGSGSGTGQPLTGLARPLGGYQVKPRYPETARRSGAQGTTLLKLQVLANGRVGEVLIEQSAGHHDLDNAAAEAVKKWLFEPARMGKEPVAVWVLLPIKFELQ